MSDLVIDEWTGRTARMLQDAMRLSNERFAEHLGVAPRTVAEWRAKPAIVPRGELQDALETAYEMTNDGVRRRFARNFPPPADATPAPLQAIARLAGEMALIQARMDELQQQLAELSRTAG
ncbi:hypothetical protein [Streptomyces coffeae]|uniref:XRE family transcriptional regulator n=1 Tax=Streptomyces coffeae TaxID=621382 RepID=A0ABS1NL16_9ACTN|nr:hypothetical protein [Streptomyces coffeae]MBL1100612.1 hypothetical protein [Streptomyces coffeae]